MNAFRVSGLSSSSKITGASESDEDHHQCANSDLMPVSVEKSETEKELVAVLRDSTHEKEYLKYVVVHCVPGRIRLRISNQGYDFRKVADSLRALMSIEGVTYMRVNSWCATAVLEYDPALLTERTLLQQLDLLSYGDEVDSITAPPRLNLLEEPLVVQWIRSLAGFIERLMPPIVQVALGAAAFAASALKWPLVVTRILLAASTAPIATRAIRTLVDERKIGIDALDGAAASLMLANGKFVEAGFMTGLIALGEYIRERTARRCEKMVSDLLGLSGRSAWLIRGKKRVRIPADEVKVGETVVIYPGDMVPVDGEVLTGEADIDQSKLTGESLPVEVKAGDKVLASTVVVEGKIYVRCQASGSQTQAGLVLQCVAAAPLHETKIQNHASALADKVVVPIFIAAGICFAVTRDVRRLMSMLILDFCTGIRIAAPTAVLSSMHRAGRRGILIKSGVALEQLSKVSAIVFDKTGTLTSGEPKVEEVSRFNGHTEDQVLALAAAVEMRLHHPAARAIVKAAQQRNLVIEERTDSEFSRSMGAKAMVSEHEVIVGSRSMMESAGILIDEARDSELRATKLGESISYVAIDGKVAGLIRYRDHLRPEVTKAMKQLKRLGIKKLVMATGDTPEAAKRIATTCGITEVISRALPQDKAELVKRLKSEGHTVAVIGDGINDSPALAYADVAISLHGATDAARHGAAVVLTDDNLERLPEAVRIARSAMALVQQNLAMAVVPNSAGFAMAALGMLGPAGATVLNNGAAMAAAVNSMRPLYSDSWSKAEPVETQQ